MILQHFLERKYVSLSVSMSMSHMQVAIFNRLAQFNYCTNNSNFFYFDQDQCECAELWSKNFQAKTPSGITSSRQIDTHECMPALPLNLCIRRFDLCRTNFLHIDVQNISSAKITSSTHQHSMNAFNIQYHNVQIRPKNRNSRSLSNSNKANH